MDHLMKKIIFSMDVENDISIYLKDSYIGIEEGLPIFMDMVKKNNILVDFFVTGNVCQKYPELIDRMRDDGHNIGCHGMDHSIKYYCTKSYRVQYEDIKKATKIIEEISGHNPTMFRTPNFSANSNTIKAIENLGYSIDSSVLPGRHVNKWRLFPIYDFRSAIRKPYTPSYEDITKEGDSQVIEIPVTENPFNSGQPIGMGFLNSRGVNKTMEIIRAVKEDYIVFLIHPWELVDLHKYYPNLREWLHKTCKKNFHELEELIISLAKHYEFSNLRKIAIKPIYLKSTI